MFGGLSGSHNNLFNAPVVHFLCNQYLIYWLWKEAARDESVNTKPVLNIWEGKQRVLQMQI